MLFVPLGSMQTCPSQGSAVRGFLTLQEVGSNWLGPMKEIEPENNKHEC